LAERQRTYYDATALPAPPRPALAGIVEAETCVIGGGFAGLATALDLAERGRDVVLLEAERIGWGASGRNGGFVAAGFPAGSLHLVETLGPDTARRLFELSRMGQALLAARIERYAIPGLAREAGALRCAMRGHDALLDQIRAGMARHFGVELELWPRDKLRACLATERYGGALFNPETFAVHPHNLALGLAEAATRNGARLFETSACTGLDLDHPTKRVSTANGEVQARTVVVACGGYVGNLLLRLQWATVPIATFVAVTEPLGPDLDRAIATRHAVSDLQFATNYYRCVEVDRLLWGGRIKAWEPGPARIARDLHRDMAAFYPDLVDARFEFVWSGLMSFLRHQMPALGQLGENVWYATGFGGLGLSLTSMAGRLIGSALTEGDQRWREFARFGLPFAGGVLGRIPAQMLYWRAEAAGRLGLVTAHD
jgi:gamma-glutamylputrescine oxidase